MTDALEGNRSLFSKELVNQFLEITHVLQNITNDILKYSIRIFSKSLDQIFHNLFLREMTQS